jgi:hypothetical protein
MLCGAWTIGKIVGQTAWLNYMSGNKPDGGFHHGACGSLPLRTLEQLKAESEKAVRALAKEQEAATIQSA